MPRAWMCRGVAAVVLAQVAACGGGGDSPFNGDTEAVAAVARIDGVAARGAPIAGATVTAVNARGERASSPTANDGRYALSIAEGAPYLLWVTDADGNTWYSYARASGRANLTPLTTLALLNANGLQPLSGRAERWQDAPLPAPSVLDAARLVNANFAPFFRQRSLDPNTLNVFTLGFDANRTGFDAMLDDVKVQIRCDAARCTQHVAGPGGVMLDWNLGLSTTGITLDWGSGNTLAVGIGSCRAPQPGTWSLVVQTTIAGAGAALVPEICIDGIADKPASSADFCASSRVRAALPGAAVVFSCAFDGSSGSVGARFLGLFERIDYRVAFTFVRR